MVVFPLRSEHRSSSALPAGRTPEDRHPVGIIIKIKTLPNIARSADFRYKKNSPVVRKPRAFFVSGPPAITLRARPQISFEVLA